MTPGGPSSGGETHPKANPSRAGARTREGSDRETPHPPLETDTEIANSESSSRAGARARRASESQSHHTSRRPSRPTAERDARVLAQVAEEGIHRLAIPTPFQVGRVNVYLIEGSPLTLVDCGPSSAEALEELDRSIAALGHRIEDVGLVAITHQHIDHFGIASTVARRSGADVASLDILAPYLETFHEQSEKDDVFAQETMLRHGVPPEVAATLRAVSASFKGWASPVHVSRPLPAGTNLTLGDRALAVLHRPGHSPSDTVFHDSARKILLAGDHLIRHISSNPLLSRPLAPSPPTAQSTPPPIEQPTSPPAEQPASPPPAQPSPPPSAQSASPQRPRALISYIASLKLTREMDLAIVLPGHGEPIVDHRSLIDERLRLHQRRAEKIRLLIAQQPLSAHQIARELWGDVAVTQAYLTLSEVIGHIDLLIDAGQATESLQEGVVIFRAS